jgi:hypothetical protein
MIFGYGRISTAANLWTLAALKHAGTDKFFAEIVRSGHNATDR